MDRRPSQWSFDRPNATAVGCPDANHQGIFIVCRAETNTNPAHWTTRGVFFLHYPGGSYFWQEQRPLSAEFSNAGSEPLNPSVAAIFSNRHSPAWPVGRYVVSTRPSTGTYDRRLIRKSESYWTAGNLPNPLAGANTARLLCEDADGAMRYAAAAGPYFESGEVIEDAPLYDLAGTGAAPALAIDMGGQRWVAYVDSDTLWVHTGDGEPEMVFAGSSSAVPGQPSIVCYSEQASSGYCAGVVFPVYDTAGGASKIMYARVDTSSVVLDTIESVANLRDSLPCISLYKTDTLLATFQHGDSVLAVMLADYGPGATGRPGAWSSPNLVTAHGYHPMSAFEQGGSVLNCVWTGKDGDNYAIHRAINDLSGGMFPSWTAQSDPSGSATVENLGRFMLGSELRHGPRKSAASRSSRATSVARRRRLSPTTPTPITRTQWQNRARFRPVSTKLGATFCTPLGLPSRWIQG
ncbi:MAG: hypothetical protein NTX53_20605 [candidate division WOR-3 bacterium]|nr:hypothetical protein [candidate division WOR-3 bacterium]